MDLIIDGKKCDPGLARIVFPSYDAARTEHIEEARQERILTITIPRTPLNDAVMGYAAELDTAQLFNSGFHTAEFRLEDVSLFRGFVRLLAVESNGYRIEIRAEAVNWADRITRNSLADLDIDWSVRLSPTTICESWTNSSLVKFFPVHRDDYEQQNSSSDLLPAERILAVEDYHPFLHVATLIEKIFDQANCQVKSRFLDSEFFQSLYMSGAYASRDTAAADNRMGFSARRLASVTATGNEFGRVTANPSALANTVGNIVDTATPLSTDSDGIVLSGLYNNGNCFSNNNGKIVFSPPTTISAGFEYYLKYTTEHRILSRTRLTGYDTIYLGPGAEFQFELANRYEDQRDNLQSGFTYRVVVFNHQEGTKYRLTYTLGSIQGILWNSFSTRSALISTPSSGTFSNPKLEIFANPGWAAYTGDWALYKGYIGETGQTTVEVRLRTPAETISPESPKYFNQIYFAGAEEGMALTLHKECALRPRFLPGPTFGSLINFSDVVSRDIRQSELLEAVAHLFNLRFYYEEQTQTVWIEPESDHFGCGKVVDWSNRTDFSQPIVRQQTLPGIHETRTWCLQEGDGAVTRFDNEEQTTLGAWSFKVVPYAATAGEQVLRNPLFAPSLNSVGHYQNAPSARILQVGNRDSTEEDGTNFSPRIVRYVGMKTLPETERWGYPSGKNEYPLVAFLDPGDESTEPFTLGFEDRDGATGLHSYYDRQLAREASGERISLTIRIEPHEFESLFSPETGAPDIRSPFRIDTGEGIVTAALREIGEYDAERASATCLFERIDNA